MSLTEVPFTRDATGAIFRQRDMDAERLLDETIYF